MTAKISIRYALLGFPEDRFLIYACQSVQCADCGAKMDNLFVSER